MAAIAIIGMACCYPDARSPQELWENVLVKRRAFRRIPPERLNLGDYFSSDLSTPDTIYAAEAALIEGYEFDRVRFRVAGPTYRSADLTHWLALDVADRALRDAGFPNGEGLPRERAGVLLGNTLTGEFSRAALMRLRWPYVRRVADAKLREEGWDAQKRRDFLEEMETLYKAPFEPVGEETLAGGLSNTIAGRICNHFDLRGGGYTLDGACSSSLLAVAHACSALEAGDLDAVLAGGVDLSLDPFELIGFSKTGALAHGEMRVYDRQASGFLPGEGCGFVLLMRYDDALAQGRPCYALIRGWGVSSDGGGGIIRPESAGQALALERAYQRAGYSVGTVALLEGHGTGTAVGDEVELRTLDLVRRASGAILPAAVGSIKANIGHTKAAAGVAGLIKATSALHAQILPPATGVEHPHPIFVSQPPALRLLETGEVWPEEAPLRAGVSSFGFGGINAHVTLEGCAGLRRKTLTAHEKTLSACAQDAELFLLGANDRSELLNRVSRLEEIAPRLSYAELADLAACLAKMRTASGVRAALVASSPKELEVQLSALRTWLLAGEAHRLDPETGLFLSTSQSAPRIGLLFPGQASPVRLEGGAMARRFAPVREVYAQAALPQGTDTISTAVAQSAIVAAEWAGLQLLQHLGVEATLTMGHSLGELAALHWAGVMDAEALLRITKMRGRVMAEVPGPKGAMASLAATPSEVEAWLKGEDRVVLAGFNAPRQTVISGEAEAVGRIVVKARTQGKAATPLPVSHAFHSPLMRPAAEDLGAYLEAEAFGPLQRCVISTIKGMSLTVRDDLRAMLKQQLTIPVRFTEALAEALPQVDLLIECGPGRVLSGLAQGQGVPVVAMDSAGPSLRGFLNAVGAAYALGAAVNTEALFADRFTRAFDPDGQPRFLINPCELAPLPEVESPSPLSWKSETSSKESTPFQTEPEKSETASVEAPSSTPLDIVRRLVAQRAELPVAAVADQDRLLRDLHLNSISVGQIVVEAARQLGLAPPLAPTEYANATVAGIAEALESLRKTGVTEDYPAETVPAGVDAWVRAFTVEKMECPLLSKPKKTAEKGRWRLWASAGHPVAHRLHEFLEAWGGSGALVCLQPQVDEGQFKLLLQAARTTLGQEGQSYFVLVQQQGLAASFARTLRQEAPNLTVCVVDTPFDDQIDARVLAEVQAAKGYAEAYYDEVGRRHEMRFRLLGVEEEDRPLSSTDVLLVSGGGKGIAAECAFQLAKETGARLALLGRSSPEQDAELAANLARLEESDVVFRYLEADVADADAVRRAVAQADCELGSVTAILHGAGINRPKLLQELDEAALHATLVAKVEGLGHLLAAVDARRLRVLITFSSIIGRTGMRGEADYALANAWLSHLTEAFQVQHPNCRCLALEWSIWSGVGMGERLGRVDALLHAGITPISPEQGTAWLKRLLSQKLPAVSVVVSGRLGATPGIPLEGRELPFWRFLEQPRVYYPCIELVAEAELSSTADPYLDDHIFQGEPLLPAVLGLEAMAQAALAVSGESRAPVFEQVAFNQPVVVGEQRKVILRTAALVRAKGLVEVVVRSSETAFQIDHFRALCRFAEESFQPKQAYQADHGIIPLDPRRELYGPLLFHGRRFQRLKAYRELAATHCCADIEDTAGFVWFGRYLPTELVLGDPASRDAAIHAVQACIPHCLLLPIGMERLALVDVQVPGPWTVYAKERRHEGDLFTYDLEVYGADGQLRERWEGLRLRRIMSAVWQEWPLALLPPLVERRIAELIPGAALASVVLERDDQASRRARSDQAIQRALGQKLRILYRPDGKPEVKGEWEVSTTHAAGLTLAVAGHAPLACDLEEVEMRDERILRDLLGTERYALAERVARQGSESLNVSATRVWAAMECLKKAGAPVNTPLILGSIEGDGWIVLLAGNMAIGTFQALQAEPPVWVIAILVSQERARLDAESSGKLYARL